jgi:hypothetical protein
MDYISIILLVVVLVAQIVLFTLYFLEKRYDSRRYSALLQYIDRRVEDADCRDEAAESVKEILDAYTEKTNERFDVVNRKIADNYSEIQKNCKNAFEQQDKEIDSRFDAVLLSYTEAQQAADKVNNFASSLASIFDYDPLKAIQRDRKKEAV